MSSEFNRDGFSRDGIISIGHSVDATTSELPDSPAVGSSNVPLDPVPAVDEQLKGVDDLLSSEIGINTLLVRLKQSIASARDFAAFLKKRSSLEEEQATGLKRLSKSHLESLKKSDVKAGSYAAQLAELMHCHERIADHGMQFALSLHQMHEDLGELGANMERGRKQWKHEGLDAEKRASDAEAAMHKAKARYDSLAEDYDRARTGDTKGSRRIGLKGPKSAEQYESDLLRKVQAADTDYEEKVRIAQGQRESLLRENRPKAVKALRELCQECDSGLALQLQKFATFNEKLLLGNGLAIAPLTDKEIPGAPKSLRDTIAEIDNEQDFRSFVRSHRPPPRPSEIRYERHPTLAPKTQVPNSNLPSAGSSLPLGANPPQSGPLSQPASFNDRFANQPPALVVAPTQNQTYNSPVAPAAAQQHSNFGPPLNAPFSAHVPPNAGPEPEQYVPPPYPTHPSERMAFAPQSSAATQPPLTTTSPTLQTLPFEKQYPVPTSRPFPSTAPRPSFGITLDEMFARDQTAVPMVVIQCILAVDTFGLDVEGIYRVSGTTSHVTHLREQFNSGAEAVDLRNPVSFSHDVNSVAQLLKQFFRDLPDPLFTRAAYSRLIDAARVEDDIERRDGLHQLINDLPDPNYATLRALVLHLHRVMQHENRNRMGSTNLALCFAPSLMGQHIGDQIADASFQARVVDTILKNATAIFDED